MLSIITNAAYAIADGMNGGKGQKGIISISTRRAGDYAEIQIGDTGKGIPVEIRPKIFDPFFTTREVGKGTGLGLTISRSIVVEKHGGTISFDTETGKGTTFIIRLPIGTDTFVKDER
ncbi:MAG: ATP-binding protein [Candidatus Brocadiaceae bacterium]|nr:ATP-binding protein [Candidatus Brocadiaceae bacterium]